MEEGDESVNYFFGVEFYPGDVGGEGVAAGVDADCF